MLKTRAAPALPPLLAPYMLSSSGDPQHNSLTLITYTLAASPLWLLLRYLSLGLLETKNDKETNDQRFVKEIKGSVVVVSFVREREAWREGSRRAGIDLSSFSSTFAHVDLLTNPLFDSSKPIEALEKLVLSSIKNLNQHRSGYTTPEWNETSEEKGQLKPMLILDGLDFWLAALAGIDGVDINGAMDFILKLREHTSTLIIPVSADSPLLFPLSSFPAGLEKSHFVLLSNLAHQANYAIQLRGLETGVARDVSGVVRISRGGGWGIAGNEDQENTLIRETKVADREGLYFQEANGGVELWERERTMRS